MKEYTLQDERPFYRTDHGKFDIFLLFFFSPFYGAKKEAFNRLGLSEIDALKVIAKIAKVEREGKRKKHKNEKRKRRKEKRRK